MQISVEKVVSNNRYRSESKVPGLETYEYFLSGILMIFSVDSGHLSVLNSSQTAVYYV